ncbi:hypothetical protein FB451DRAFT_1429268 [Mycena latifolia]|nr:hypothetical protein FB451DRAFT_1429268 [Mycena latifolia]
MSQMHLTSYEPTLDDERSFLLEPLLATPPQCTRSPCLLSSWPSSLPSPRLSSSPSSTPSPISKCPTLVIPHRLRTRRTCSIFRRGWTRSNYQSTTTASLSFDATAFLSTYTPVELDASIFIGTALDAGEKSFSMVHYVATSAPLSAAVYPASSLLTVMLVLIALRMAVPRVCEDLECRVRAFDVRRAARRAFVVAFCLCRFLVAVDAALGRALVLAVLGAVDLVLAIDLAIERAAVRGYEELEEVHSADERRCRPDRARVLTDTPATPPRTSTRDRTCSAPGHLVLVPAAPTAAGAAVWRVVRVVPPIAPIAPSAPVKVVASPRVCRPDRARVVTDTPAKAPRRLRTPSAPGHLVLVPMAPTPVGAAVKRVIPLSSLRIVPHAPRIPSTPLVIANAASQNTPSTPRDVPGAIMYQTAARQTSGAILYQTPAGPPPAVIYSTGPAPPTAQNIMPRSPRSSRRASTILFHARSDPPSRTALQQTVAPYHHLVSHKIARIEAEARQRDAWQPYLAQHRPHTFAHRLQEERRPHRTPNTITILNSSIHPILGCSTPPSKSNSTSLPSTFDLPPSPPTTSTPTIHHHDRAERGGRTRLPLSASPGSTGQTCLAGLGAWTRKPELEPWTHGSGSRRTRCLGQRADVPR